MEAVRPCVTQGIYYGAGRLGTGCANSPRNNFSAYCSCVSSAGSCGTYDEDPDFLLHVFARLTFLSQVATQAGLTNLATRYPLLQFWRQVLLDNDVRHDALCLNGTTGGCVVASRGEPKSTVSTEGHDGLNRPLAERTRPDDGGALLVLERAGHDFRCGCRSTVDENHDRLAIGDIARLGGGPLRLLDVATFRQHDRTSIEEIVADLDSLIEKTARIVAKVNDVTFDGLASLALEIGDLLDEISHASAR